MSDLDELERLVRRLRDRGFPKLAPVVRSDLVLRAADALEASTPSRASQPVQVEVTEAEVVQVFWYEHDCEWLSKYCDEHHRRSALVPRSALGGGDHDAE